MFKIIILTIIIIVGNQSKEHVDYYAVLGVPKDAPVGVITKAYYKLARENHPVC